MPCSREEQGVHDSALVAYWNSVPHTAHTDLTGCIQPTLASPLTWILDLVIVSRRVRKVEMRQNRPHMLTTEVGNGYLSGPFVNI